MPGAFNQLANFYSQAGISGHILRGISWGELGPLPKLRVRATLRRPLLQMSTTGRAGRLCPAMLIRGFVMAMIRDLLSRRTIHYVQPEQTVFEAANYMVQCNVGAVPVLDGTKLVGIFSERDIMKRVVSEARDPMTTRISEVMSTDIHTVAPTATCHDAMTMMQEYAVRHLPVCDGSTLVGFLSLRDLLHQKLDETVGEAESLRAYIQTGAS